MRDNKNGAPPQLGTVKSKYEETKKSTDAALKAAEEPLDPKDEGKTESALPNDGEDFLQGANRTTTLYSLGGLNSLLVTGNEGLVDSVKEGAAWLIRRVTDIFNWILDYTFNRVTSLRRKITRLKYAFNDNGIILRDVKYPRSVVRLTSTPNVPPTPEFALKTLESAEAFYTKCMRQQTQIASLTRAFPADVTRDQLLNFADSLANSYVNGMGGKKVKENLYEIEMPSGFQVLKCNIDRRRGFNGFGIAEYFQQRVNVKIPEHFTPSSDVVQRLILKADVYLMDIERVHKSQRSFANNFKRSLEPMVKGAKMYPEQAKAEIMKYYRWLINYQNKSVTIPLNYHLSVLSSCVDLAKVQIQLPKG